MMWQERNGGFDFEVFESDFSHSHIVPFPSRALHLTFRLRPPHGSFGNRSLHMSSEALGARTRHWINREGFRISSSLGAPDTDQRLLLMEVGSVSRGCTLEGFSPPFDFLDSNLGKKPCIISLTEKLLRHPRRGGNRWLSSLSSSTERNVPRTAEYIVAQAVSPRLGPARANVDKRHLLGPRSTH